MSKKRDWIKVYRSVLKSEVWTAEPFTRAQAWIDLLLLANWAPGFRRIRGVRVEVNRGQVLASCRFLAERWMWSIGKVSRFLDELKTESQIDTQTSNVTQLITIVNYERYQGDDSADRHTDGAQTGAQTERRQAHRTIQIKEETEEETKEESIITKKSGDFFTLPKSFDTDAVRQQVRDWIDFFPRKWGAPFTQIELDRRLMDLSREGWSAEELSSSIHVSIKNGWKQWIRPISHQSSEVTATPTVNEREMTQEQIDKLIGAGRNGKTNKTQSR